MNRFNIKMADKAIQNPTNTLAMIGSTFFIPCKKDIQNHINYKNTGLKHNAV